MVSFHEDSVYFRLIRQLASDEGSICKSYETF